MFLFRQIILVLVLLAATALPVTAQPQTTDSLQQVLSKTVDPVRRVQLLLDLKDLNEDSNLNIPLSIRLFREAAAIDDVYSLGVAIVPIANRYAPYSEQVDSLEYYIRTLRTATRGETREGLVDFVEMIVGFHRLHNESPYEERRRTARQTVVWSDSTASQTETACAYAKRLLLLGYARQILARHASDAKGKTPWVESWEKAYAATHRMEDVTVRKYFANVIFYALNEAYYRSRRYDDQVRLIRDYLAVLDAYVAYDKATGRRRYLYTDNTCVRPYRELIRASMYAGRKDLAEQYFSELRSKLLAGENQNADRNRSYLYEAGYMYKGLTEEYDQAVSYADSLLYLIDNDKGYFQASPQKAFQASRARSRMLTRAGRYKEALASYAHTSRMLDSLLYNEHRERARTILQQHEIDRLKLAETRSAIRNNLTALVAFIALASLVLGAGIYFFRTWQRNRRMQADILRHSRKASESEHMKSIFVNRICRGVGPTLDRIDQTTHALILADTDTTVRSALLDSIRHSTEILLSTLDNMLEAARLDSLTDSLPMEPVNVDEICHSELLTASRLQRNDRVEYRIEGIDACIVRTHRQYFAFVIRTLLDNAGKATRSGSICLRYTADRAANTLDVTVTDTGCGIPPERREEIFRPANDGTTLTRGLSLPLCRLIARHLSGSIRLDEAYGPGARFIFTIPIEP